MSVIINSIRFILFVITPLLILLILLFPFINHHHGDERVRKSKVYVKKCLHRNETYVIETYGNTTVPIVVPNDEPDRFRTEFENKILNASSLPYSDYVIRSGDDPCLNSIPVLVWSNYTFRLTVDGKLRIDDLVYSTDGYCLEWFQLEQLILPIICVRQSEQIKETRKLVYAFGLAISVSFLLTTVFAYILIGKLKTLDGKTIICHFTTMSAGYLCLILKEIHDYFLKDGNFCLSLAYGKQFSFLASFFWLNAFCYNVWQNFRRKQKIDNMSSETRFICYSIYAWGCPFIISIITWLAENRRNIMPDIFISPDIGNKSCWFDDHRATLYYFYGPIGILLAFNIIMFIITSVNVYKSWLISNYIFGPRPKRFSTCLKLFILMGVNWIMELISWAVGGPKYFWYLPDMFNIFQGVVIFYIFIYNNKILDLLKRKFFMSNTSMSTIIGTIGSSKSLEYL